MVRVVRLERTVSWSQTRRDTNFAIPGYSISSIIPRRAVKTKFFCLWSFLWSKPLLCRFRQPGEIQQTQVSQGFAAFRLTLSRIPPRHSQTTRATNCANPGFLSIQFCFNCGQTCGQTVFLTISAYGGSACIAGVSRNCGHSIFQLEVGATRSQTRRDTNFAIPGYSISAIIPRPTAEGEM